MFNHKTQKLEKKAPIFQFFLIFTNHIKKIFKNIWATLGHFYKINISHNYKNFFYEYMNHVETLL